MEEILFRDLDATSISDTLTLVDENEVSMDLAIDTIQSEYPIVTQIIL